MIGRLTGILLEKSPPHIVLDVQGVGYELDIPMSTLYTLPAVGERVTLHTQLLIREDAHVLVGFATLAERAAFRQLLKVSGIGARTALAILSGASVDELAQAVAQQDAAWLTRLPGIGKKTAERLLLELRDKLEPLATPIRQAHITTPAAQTASVSQQEALQALVALGYAEREATTALKTLSAELSVEDLIRQGLRHLARVG